MTIEEGAQKAFEGMESSGEEVDENGAIKNLSPTQNTLRYLGWRRR